VLRKLVHVYSGMEIGGKFFEALKQQRR